MKQYFSKIYILTLLLSLIFYSNLISQIEKKSYVWQISAAKNLTHARIDTTNIERIKQIADSAEHILNCDAYLFLAQHGDRTILPKVYANFNKSLGSSFFGISNWQTSSGLLMSIMFLEGDGAYPYVKMLFDSMRVQNQEARIHYFPDEFVDIEEILLDYEDYSQYLYIKSLFNNIDRPQSENIFIFYRFAQKPTLTTDAFETTKSFLSDTSTEYRYEALRTINWFKDQSDRTETLKRVAMNDASSKVWCMALQYLLRQRNIADAVNIFKNRIHISFDTRAAKDFLRVLGFINSPFALAAMESLNNESFLDSIKKDIDFYINVISPEPPVTSSLAETIDSLGGFVSQCASLQWIGGQSYINQLKSYTQNAKKYLVHGDSLNCARYILQFQKAISFEFYDSSNTTTDFVTFEGGTFLSHNGQYILDHLPPIPTDPYITSVIPESVLAGSDGFILTLQGRGFLNPSKIYWNSTAKTTSYISDSVLQANILSNDITKSGTIFISERTKYDASDSIQFNILPRFLNCAVKLLSSSGSLLTGGTLQYRDSTWKDATNNNDGTFTFITSQKKTSLRMTYANSTQTTSNVTIKNDTTIIFQTINVAVNLQNSQGNPLDTGVVQYNAGGWKDFGTTSNGVVTKELLPIKYAFRLTYNGATISKSQNIDSSATVVFQTVPANVQLQTSTGSALDTGIVQYYAGAWKDFGITSNGVVTKELLPAKHTFRITYNGATISKAQNIDSNATVIFQTVKTLVQFNNSKGNPIDTGIVQFNSGGWKDFGSTLNGSTIKELLPAKYTFRLTYNGATISKAQNLDSNATVVFSTVLCTVSVTNSSGNPLNNATVSYNASGWKVIGTTTNGIITKELLPVKIQFRAAYGTKQQSVTQDVSVNPLIQIVLPVQ